MHAALLRALPYCHAGESDNDKVGEEYSFGLQGAVGYVGPFPAAVPAAIPETCTRSSTWLVTVQVG